MRRGYVAGVRESRSVSYPQLPVYPQVGLRERAFGRSAVDRIRTCVRVAGRRSSRLSTRCTTLISDVLELSFDALTTPELLRCWSAAKGSAATTRRRAPADQPTSASRPTRPSWAANWPAALANRLRITRADASPTHPRGRRPGTSAGRDRRTPTAACWRRPPQRNAPDSSGRATSR